MTAPVDWSAPAFLEEAAAWVRAELARVGAAVAGPIEQPHLRPWSTVLRVPTTAGDYFFKATLPALGFEPALTQALAGLRPDCIAPVVAIAPARGWMLMPSGGPTLRSLIQADVDPLSAGLRHWQTILPLYAGLQQTLIPHAAEVLGLGALDRRLARLPADYACLLEDEAALGIGRADGLAPAEHERLQALRPRLEDLCATLAAGPIPETLHHDDFHDGNIFVRAGRPSAYAIFDWAESGIAFPFFSLVVGLRAIGYRLGLEPDAPQLARLRDAYLSAWSGYASLDRLLFYFRLSQPVGMVCRALTWHHVLSALPAPQRAEYPEPVPGWLQDWLSASETL
jgi:hypothetical protein